MHNYILDKEKYAAAIIYLVNKLGKINGKKKAYKLLYFLDFDFFEAYEKPFTGETYTALPMGPVPRYFDGIVDQLVKDGYIEIKKVVMSPMYENPAVIYIPKKKMNYRFSKQEQKMLDRVVDKYGSLTGKDLEVLSHAQPPYAAVELGEVIPYEYSYYRNSQDLV